MATKSVVDVASLTDEEMVVIEGPEHRAATPLPWLENQARDHWDAMCTSALRSLVARGIVDPRRGGDEVGGIELGLPPELSAALALRRTANATLIAEQVANPDRQSFLVLFDAGEHDGVGIAVTEEIAPRGLHTIRIGPLPAMLELVAAFTDPTGPSPALSEGKEWRLTEAEFESGKLGELATASCVTGLEVQWPAGQRGTGKERAAIYCLADGLRISEPAGDDLLVRTADRAGVHQLVGQLLASRPELTAHTPTSAP